MLNDGKPQVLRRNDGIDPIVVSSCCTSKSISFCQDFLALPLSSSFRRFLQGKLNLLPPPSRAASLGGVLSRA